jgi:hypothetical protein
MKKKILNKKNADQRQTAADMRQSASTMRKLTRTAKNRETARRENVNQADERKESYLWIARPSMPKKPKYEWADIRVFDPSTGRFKKINIAPSGVSSLMKTDIKPPKKKIKS